MQQLTAAIENPGYEIIPAVDATSIGNLQIEIRQGESKRKKLKDIEKGFDEADLYDSGDDVDIESWLSGTYQSVNLNQFAFRWFLNITGNFSKKQLASKYRYLFRAWQIIFTALLTTYIFFQFGAGKLHSTVIKPVVVADSGLPFTTAHDALWELKWLFAYLLGMAYYSSGHLEKFLSRLRLPRDVYQKGKHHALWYILLFSLTVVVLPTIFHALQLYDLMKSKTSLEKVREIGVCDSFYLLFRVVTVPSFCVITAVLYLIKVQIDTLGRILKCLNVNLGKPYAEREIRDVKMIIRTADTKLKWYLICHLMLILMTAFTGMLSYIERIHVNTGIENRTILVQQSLENPASDTKRFIIKAIQLKEEMKTFDQEAAITEEPPWMNTGQTEEVQQQHAMMLLSMKINRLQKLNRKLLNLTFNDMLERQMKRLAPAVNISLKIKDDGKPPFKIEFLEKTRPLRVFLESIVGLVEVVILFLIPLMLLAWHQRALLRITDEIADLDVEEQRRHYFLIDCKQTKDDIVSYLKSMRGVTIFGMQVSLYKGAFITMLAPFVTVTLHLIFKRYNLK